VPISEEIAWGGGGAVFRRRNFLFALVLCDSVRAYHKLGSLS